MSTLCRIVFSQSRKMSVIILFNFLFVRTVQAQHQQYTQQPPPQQPPQQQQQQPQCNIQARKIYDLILLSSHKKIFSWCGQAICHIIDHSFLMILWKRILFMHSDPSSLLLCKKKPYKSGGKTFMWSFLVIIFNFLLICE